MNYVNLQEFIGRNILVPKISTIITKTKKNEQGEDVYLVEILTPSFVTLTDAENVEKIIPLSLSVELKTEEKLEELISKFLEA